MPHQKTVNDWEKIHFPMDEEECVLFSPRITNTTDSKVTVHTHSSVWLLGSDERVFERSTRGAGWDGLGDVCCETQNRQGHTHTQARQAHTRMQEDRNETTKHKHQGRTDCHLAQTDDFTSLANVV